MRVVLAALALALALGCRGGEPTAPPRIPPPPAESAPDPWAAPTSDPDAPPDLGERRRLANQACPTVKAPYFYQIEKAGKVSHVLGTRHIGVPLAKFPPSVHAAIDSAVLAVFEIDPADDGDHPTRALALRVELGPQLWLHYEKLVGRELARTLEHATPTEATLALIALYEDVGAMLDLEIENRVLAASIPTAGLETSEFQGRLLAKLFDVRALRAMISTTRDRTELADESRRDLAEYCAGSRTTPGIDDEMRAELLSAGYTTAELDAIDEELVFARNEAWIPKLEPLLARGRVFVAVGADHLHGARGVVALLQARGFALTRVTN